MRFLAAGLVGAGSECLGFDDEISTDHDFEPGFCLFLPGEDVVDRRTAFLLERAYAKLPKQFLGFERSLIAPVGGSRHGVIRTADFFNALFLSKIIYFYRISTQWSTDMLCSFQPSKEQRKHIKDNSY